MKTLTKYVILFILFIIFTSDINSQSAWVQQNSGTTSNVTAITFLNYNSGYALASPIIKTSNGGVNWIPLPGNPLVASMSWPDVNTGYIGNSTVYKTTDGGLNWVNLNQNYVGKISFPNTTTGYAICLPEFVPGPDITYYRAKKTSNAGINWNVCLEFSTYNTALVSYGFYYVQARTPQVVYVGVRQDNYEWHTYWSRVYRTQNGGGSWDYVMHSADTLVFRSFHFPSADTGYVVAMLQPETGTYFIYKYENFTSRLLLTTNQVNGIYFPNNTTGYIATGVNNMFKTTNGGNNWYAISSPGSNQIYGFTFIDALTGYAVGSNGFIAKTTTGGETPVIHSVSGTVRYQDNNQPVTSGYVKAVRFDTATYSIITVDSAQIQSNGTYTLSSCPPVTIDIMAYENDEEDLSFVATYYVSTIYWQNATHVKPDSNLANIDIGVYRIVNTGVNRSISGYIYRGTSMDYDFVKDAFVYAKSDGYYKGYSISTSNGFYQIDSLANGTYEVIVDRMGYFPSTQFAYVNGGNISNFNFTLMAVLNAEKTGSSIPSEYSLYQNYPNPFNPKTEIHFALPKESEVRLVIFDMLGREIAILANGLYKAGDYKVKWDSDGFSSGIYFYRFTAGNYSESKKMVLIK